ncbi:molecular chaperone TorD family protein [Methylonatrum kenyense]|uniref:TorD/DmsD family molecular chaperone n=1 Tax=Methylonatrum kenyense TaxID=455253 RepID=UPI0020BF9B0F|nr:molecular chaperone TorD family protein [Methylonatrum kenyense]MCK8516347.1 molecular chaperone TorD family protein [Methylonatrum kenyense]
MSAEKMRNTDLELGELLSRAYRARAAARFLAYPEPDEEEALEKTLIGLEAQGALLADDSERKAISDFVSRWRHAGAEVLRAEYARLFLGPTRCSLYSATYGSGGNLAGPAAGIADVSGFYQAFGVDIREEQPERPDHLAAELEFYSSLLVRLAYATHNQWNEAAVVTGDAARSFLRDHLGRWSGVVSRRLEQLDSIEAYRALANWLDVMLREEATRLDVDVESYGIPDWSTQAGAEPMHCPRDDDAEASPAQPIRFRRSVQR